MVPNPVPAKLTVVVPSAFTGDVTEVTTGWTAIAQALAGEQVAVTPPEETEMGAAELGDPSPPESVTHTSDVAEEAPTLTAQATPPMVTDAVAGANSVPVRVIHWFPVTGVRFGVTEDTVAAAYVYPQGGDPVSSQKEERVLTVATMETWPGEAAGTTQVIEVGAPLVSMEEHGVPPTVTVVVPPVPKP